MTFFYSLTIFSVKYLVISCQVINVHYQIIARKFHFINIKIKNVILWHVKFSIVKLKVSDVWKMSHFRIVSKISQNSMFWSLRGGIDPAAWYIFSEQHMKEKNVKFYFFIFCLQYKCPFLQTFIFLIS